MPSSKHLSPLPELAISDDCNYIAAFLTMACPYRCSYCINSFESEKRSGWNIMSGGDWIAGLSRLVNLERPGGLVPVTLQGGEPSVHPDFYEIINGLPERIRIDILTNLCFDVEEMIERVDPERLRREAPYASIRVSYHPGQMEVDELLAKTHRLLETGFHIGIWAVLHPDQAEHVLSVQKRAQREGVDFRTKEFLGIAHGKLYGNYKYPDACSLQTTRQALCRTTELIIAPDGGVYRCHHDLYEQFEPVGHILDPDFQKTGEFLPCDCYGHCNPCDVKIKTNRLQQFGHTSVTIKNLVAQAISE
ncbi:radical SAM protein [Planctomycetota bacterium]